MAECHWLDPSLGILPHAGKRPLALVTPEMARAARESNAAWIEDCLVLLLCVLALDRFGDYGSDQVTAPVSDMCSRWCISMLLFGPTLYTLVTCLFYSCS